MALKVSSDIDAAVNIVAAYRIIRVTVKLWYDRWVSETLWSNYF